MARVLPEWQPFELETENPTPLELPGRRGPGVVLLASPSVHESGWGARAAAQIAGLRAARSRRILLGDLAVESPRLHELLEVENDVGMSDVFLFGTSIQKTARKADGGFLFSPAGTAAPDPARILQHDRWVDVLEGFERAEADLFLYVPWSSAGWQSLVATVGNVVVLAGRHEVAALDIPDGAEVRIGAVLGPPDRNGGGAAVVTSADAPPMDVPEPRAPEEASGGEALGTADGEPAGGADEVVEEEAGDVSEEAAVERPYPAGEHARDAEASDGDDSPDDAGASEELDETDAADGTSGAGEVAVTEEPAAASAPEPAGGPGARVHEPDLDTTEIDGPEDAWPTDERRDEPSSDASSSRLWLTIVLVLAVVAAAIAAAVVLLRGPGDASGSPGEPSAPVSVAEGGESEEVETADVEGEASATEGVTAAGVPEDTGPADALRPFVVRIAAYQEVAAAEDARASLAARLDGAQVLRVPVDVDGVVWHRIVAGPASDAAGARALRTRAAGLLGVDTTRMLVRSAPLAFQLDAGQSLAAMRERAEGLRARGIPAYVLESSGAEGRAEFRVYAGAFESPDDAVHLRTLLADAGVTDAALVERAGRHPGA